ncbi:MAG: hypothetical protein AAF901_09560, partial [Bacteroidota bacterium]
MIQQHTRYVVLIVGVIFSCQYNMVNAVEARSFFINSESFTELRIKAHNFNTKKKYITMIN